MNFMQPVVAIVALAVVQNMGAGIRHGITILHFCLSAEIVACMDSMATVLWCRTFVLPIDIGWTGSI